VAATHATEHRAHARADEEDRPVHLNVTLDLPADLPTAMRMLADPDYVHAKVRATGALDQQVDVVEAENGAFTVTTRRSLPTDQIPANLRAFVGSSLHVRQVEAWDTPRPDGGRRGTVVVEITGAPVRLTGTMVLAARGSTSTLTYDGDLKAGIPLFAGAVESAAADAIRDALSVEGVVAARWLEGHGTGGEA
jgi:hypothetical protein